MKTGFPQGRPIFLLCGPAHDKAKVGDAKIFRREGWTGPLIVSEEIHDALERMGATGTRFEEC